MTGEAGSGPPGGTRHVPVLLAETLRYLAVRPDGIYLDCTAGLGGHTAAIARQLTSGTVVASDRDAESLAMARAHAAPVADRVRFVRGRFSEVQRTLADAGFTQVDGLLADLGVSRYQLTTPERGFTLLADGPLDMRMDRDEEETAADLVNRLSERELADLLFTLAEETRSRQIAHAIVRARPVRGTQQLADVVASAKRREGKLHPATQTFMALRMAVNREQEELDSLLAAVPGLVRPGGRVVMLTFMSVEDRKVKRAFQAWARDGRAVVLTKHVVKPTDEEISSNPPSRSAKLRAAEASGQGTNQTWQR